MFSRENIIKAGLIGLVQITVFAALFLFCRGYVKRIIVENRQKDAAYLNPASSDTGLTRINREPVINARPQKVTAGIYLDRIEDFDIVHSRWTYEFDGWFKWNPKKLYFLDLADSVKGAINVSKCPIKIVDGTISNIETDAFYLNPAGDAAYILLHITATSTRIFDVSEYPLDNYLLMIQIEDDNDDIGKFAFVPDTANSNVSSRVAINGFEKGKFRIITKPHTIKSTLGDPRKIADNSNSTTYSQLRLGLYVKRGGLAIYFKMFITLYIAALLGFLSFFAAENDKMRVIVGSLFFAAATLNIIISKIPTTSGISVAEIISDISLVTILFIAARETVVKRLLKNNTELDVLNKWITFGITFIFYIVINIAIPMMCINALK